MRKILFVRKNEKLNGTSYASLNALSVSEFIYTHLYDSPICFTIEKKVSNCFSYPKHGLGHISCSSHVVVVVV